MIYNYLIYRLAAKTIIFHFASIILFYVICSQKF